MGIKIRILIVGLLAVLVVAACSPPPVLRDDKFLKDTSLITGEPCEAPCWLGITPGVTTWNEARTMIEDNTLFANLSFDEPTDKPYKLAEFDAREGAVRCCRVYAEDGKTISSVFTLVAPGITFGQVTEQYGDPGYYNVEKVTDDQASVVMVYPNVPMILYVFAAGIEKGVIDEASEVFGTVYLTEKDMQDALTNSTLYAWTGMGTLADLTAGEFALTPVPTTEATAEPGS